MEKLKLFSLLVVLVVLSISCDTQMEAAISSSDPRDLQDPRTDLLSKKRDGHDMIGTWRGIVKLVSDAGFTELSVMLEIVEQQDSLLRGSMRVGPQVQDTEIYGIMSGKNMKASQRWVVISGKVKNRNKLTIDLQAVARTSPAHGVFTHPYAATGTLTRS